jgi:hypothetical protein
VSTVALQRSDFAAMTNTELGSTVSDSCSVLNTLSREAQKEFRGRLLPALREVRERYRKGQVIDGHVGIESYYHSLGLNPATVRTWELRAREEIKKLSTPVKPVIKEIPSNSWTADDNARTHTKAATDRGQTVHHFADATKDAEEQEREYLASLTPEEREIDAFFTKQAEDFAEAFKQQEETNNRRALEEQKRKADLAAKLAIAEKLVNAGYRALAREAHPDAGGSSEKMHELTKAVEWLRGQIAVHQPQPGTEAGTTGGAR